MSATDAALPFARYGRVSRVGGRKGEGYISKKEQDRITLAVGRDRKVPVLHGPMFFDENQSGGNLDRRGFQEALALVREGKVAGIIVATFDRVSRDEEDTFAVINEVENLGGRLLCGDGDVSLATSEKALHTGVRVIFSAFERRRKGEGLSAAVKRSVATNGVHLSVPFGYERSNGKSTKLKVFEPEAKVVRLMFKRRAEGWSWDRIAAEANALAATGEGRMPRPRRRKRDEEPVESVWTHKTVRGIVLDRKVYLGTAFNGEHEFPGAHTAIVDEHAYKLANKAKGTKPRGRDGGYLATGFARCATCGHVLVHSGEGYRCLPNQHADGVCPSPVGVPADKLERVLLAEFYAHAFEWRASAVAEDITVQAAEAELQAALRRLKHRMDYGVEHGDVMDDDERALHEDGLGEDRDRVRHARAQLQRANLEARALDLPAELTVEEIERMLADGQVAEVRTFMSRVLATLVVRRSARWREPVNQRVRVFTVDQAPLDNAGRIAFVRGLRDQ